MSRWKKIVLAILLVPVLAAATVFAIPSMRTKLMGYLRGEVFFAGQPASVWANDLAAEANEGKKGPAYDQLKAGGKSALPVLLELGVHGDAKTQGHARLLLVELGDAAVSPLSRVLKRPTAADRKMAVIVLGEMGGRAKGAVKGLNELINDSDAEVRAEVLVALGKIGPDAVGAVPPLVDLLKEADKGRALQAAAVIAKIGPEAKDAVPDLVKNLEMDHKDYGPINAALVSIGEPSVPPLIAILDSKKSPAIRARAAKICQVLGPKAKDAVPALAKSLTENAADLNKEACQALIAMGKDALPASSALLVVVRDPASPIRGLAVQTLGQIGPAAEGAIPALIDVLKEAKKTAVFDDVKIALGKMGPAAQPAVPILLATFGSDAPMKEIGPVAIPDLVRLLPDAKGEINPHAKLFLESFKKEDVVPHLLKAAIDENTDLRHAAVTLLGPKTADPKVDVLYALLTTLHDGDESTRQAARKNLEEFGKSAQFFLERAIEGKDQALSTLRFEALQLLEKIGPAAKTPNSGRMLVDVLKEEGKKNAKVDVEKSKEDVAEAQKMIDKAKTDKDAAALKQATESLAKAQAALKSAEFELHKMTELEWLVVRVLAMMQYHPKDAMPVLQEALAEKKDLAFTVEQVGLQGKQARESIPALNELAKDKDAKIRLAAVRALGYMGLEDLQPIDLPSSLVSALKDSEPTIRAAAAATLGSPTSPRKFEKVILAPLQDALQDPDVEVLRAAITTLGKLENKAKPAVPAILKLIEDKPMLQDVCVIALGRIEKDAKDKALSTKLLLGLLEKKSGNVADVIDALGSIRVPEAVKLLEPIMKRENGTAGVAAALALWRDSNQAIPFLLDQSKNKDVAERAVAALGKIPNIGVKAEEQVLAILADRSANVRVRAAAATALGEIRPKLLTEKVLRALSDALQAPDRNLRICAAEALGKFRGEALPYRGRLEALMEDMESCEVRDAANVANDRIGE